MKKFFAFLAVSAALVACGGKTETTEATDSTTVAPVEAPAPVADSISTDSAAVKVDSAAAK